jgi:uncharacterized iron-regulated protein
MTHRTRTSIVLCLAVLAAVGPTVHPGNAAACLAAGQWGVPEAGRVELQSAAQVLARLARQQVVLLGENHDNAEHHRWQLHTLAGLHAIRPAMVIGFEMFPRRVQPVLDRWVAGELTEEQLLAQTEWSKVWGEEASIYMPLFQFARMNRLPMIALNVERGLVSRVGEQGWSAIPAAEREGVTDPAPADRHYLEHLYDSFVDHHHAGAGHAKGRAPTDVDLAEPRFRRFVEGQQVWDRAMAQRLAERIRGEQPPLGVGIMGSGHMRGGHGVPDQLRHLGVRDIGTALPWDAIGSCATVEAGVADAVYGIQARPAPEAPRPRLGISIMPAPNGVRIREVTPGSLAEQSGLRVGDVITGAAGEPVREPGDVIAIVRRQPPGTILPLTVQREDQTLDILARFPRTP